MDKFLWSVAFFICIVQSTHSTEILEMAPKNFTLPIDRAKLDCPDTLRNLTPDFLITLHYGTEWIATCSSDGNFSKSPKYGFLNGTCCPLFNKPTVNDSGKYVATKTEHTKDAIQIIFDTNFDAPLATSVNTTYSHEDDKEYNVTTTKTTPGWNNKADEHDPCRVEAAIGNGVGILVLMVLALVVYIIYAIYPNYKAFLRAFTCDICDV